tara:strand:+ start:1205 stop:1516 length:312 start_codon:yes stop_codon:yes gene_type:complete
MVSNDYETLDLYEAADFLKMHWQTLRSKAVRGEIPAAKPAKQWVFLKQDLVSYLRSIYAQSRLELQVQNGGSSLCCISDQIQSSGGVSSLHQTDSEYRNLLKQ